MRSASATFIAIQPERTGSQRRPDRAVRSEPRSGALDGGEGRLRRRSYFAQGRAVGRDARPAQVGDYALLCWCDAHVGARACAESCADLTAGRGDPSSSVAGASSIVLRPDVCGCGSHARAVAATMASVYDQCPREPKDAIAPSARPDSWPLVDYEH